MEILFRATPIKALALKPGDLFSIAGPEYWNHPDPLGIAEKVWIRTQHPAPDEAFHSDYIVYKIEIIKGE